MKLTTLKPRLASLVTNRIPTIQPTERMRGRAAVNRRARWLQEHPLCEMCEARGQVKAGDVVDHRIPLWKGGADDYEANGQTLCHADHDAKTATEAAERARGG
jgi:5-methylcytosine-specific restriction protein A